VTVSRLGYSRQGLFVALPGLARVRPDLAEKLLTELREEVAGHPFEELKLLRDEAGFREETGDLAESIRLSEEVIRRCRARGATEAELRWETASLVIRRLTGDDPEQHRLAEPEIAWLAEGSADSALSTALAARASARLRTAGIGPGDDGELTDEQHAAALESWGDLGRAAACSGPPAQQENARLGRVALCRVLRRESRSRR
jgi:hypothetical protein